METKPTPEMQRVLDALLEGNPVPEDARTALNEAERAEIAALAATAVLTRAALHEGEPGQEAEEASLRRAQDTLTRRPPWSPRPSPTPGIGLFSWLARWRRGG